MLKETGVIENIFGWKISRKLELVKGFQDTKMEAFDEKILDLKIGVKIPDRKWVKCKQSVKKNSKPENWHEKLKISLKFFTKILQFLLNFSQVIVFPKSFVTIGLT